MYCWQTCRAGGAHCESWIDGYYVELLLSVLFGIALFPWCVRKVRNLCELPQTDFVPQRVQMLLQRQTLTPVPSNSNPSSTSSSTITSPAALVPDVIAMTIPSLSLASTSTSVPFTTQDITQNMNPNHSYLPQAVMEAKETMSTLKVASPNGPDMNSNAKL